LFDPLSPRWRAFRKDEIGIMKYEKSGWRGKIRAGGAGFF